MARIAKVMTRPIIDAARPCRCEVLIDCIVIHLPDAARRFKFRWAPTLYTSMPKIFTPANEPLIVPGTKRRVLSRPDFRGLIVPRLSAAPLGGEVDFDDLVIHRSYRVFDSQAPAEVKYMMYELSQRNPEDHDYAYFWKAVRMVRVTRVPRYLRISASSGPNMVFEQQRDILAALREKQVLFLNVIAKSASLPMIFAYGVQGVGNSPEDAQRSADEAWAVLREQLNGVFQQLQFRQLTMEQAESLVRYQSEWGQIAMARGRPVPAGGNFGMGNFIDGNRTEVESSLNQLESFLRGMVDREFILSMVTVPISPEDMTLAWRNISTKLSQVRSEQQGSRSFMAGVALPLSLGASMANSAGVGHNTTDTTGVGTALGTNHTVTDGTNSGTSTSLAHGTSLGHTDGTSTSLAHSTGTSQGVSHSVGQTTGTNQSVTDTTGTSQTSTTGTSTTDTTGSSVTDTTGRSVTDTTSQSLSTGVASSTGISHTGTSSATSSSSASASQGSSTGNTAGQSSSSGVHGGVAGVIGGSQGAGSSSGQSSGQSASSTVSQGSSATVGSSVGTTAGRTTSVGTTTGTSVGVTDSTSRAVGTSQSVAVGTSQSESIGTSQSVATTQGTSQSLTDTSGTSSGTNQSDTAGTGTSAAATTGSSTTATTGSNQGVSASTANGTSDTNSTSQSLANGSATSFGSTSSLASTFGAVPSAGVSISRNVYDESKRILGDVIEAQMLRYVQGVESGAFFYQMFLTCPDRETLLGAAGLLKSSFWGAGTKDARLPQPFHTITEFDPDEAERLLLHSRAFSQFRRREPNMERIEQHLYSSYVTPTEMAAFCHPPTSENPGIMAMVDSMPILTMPNHRQHKDLHLGRVINGERAMVSDVGYGIDVDEITHTLIAGTTGIGKTTTLMTMLTEASRVRRTIVERPSLANPVPRTREVRAGILGLDWMSNMRDLASVVEKERFRFFSIAKPELGEFRWNPLAVPDDDMDPVEWAGDMADNMTISFNLGEFGRSIIAELISDLYTANRLEDFVLRAEVRDIDTGKLVREGVVLPAINRADLPARAISRGLDGKEYANVLSFPALSRLISMSDLATLVLNKVEEAATVEGARLHGPAFRDRIQSLWRRVQYFAPGSMFATVFACDERLDERTTLGVSDLIDPDKGLVSIIEADGLDLTNRRFILGSVLLAVWRYGQFKGSGCFDHNGQGPGTFVCLEEAHELFGDQGRDEDAFSAATRTSLYESMFRRARALGMKLVVVVQNCGSIPSAVTSNTTTVMIHRQYDDNDRKRAFSLLSWDHVISGHLREWRYLSELPRGYLIVRLDAKESYLESSPVQIKVDPAALSPVSDSDLRALTGARIGTGI